MERVGEIGVKTYEKALPFEKRSCMNNFTNFAVMFGKLFQYWFLCTLVFLKKLLLPVHVKSIDNQIVLVTGGANGLGRAICFRFASEGCHIAVADMDYTNAQIVAEELLKLDVKAKAYKCDVSDCNAVIELKNKIENDLGPIDILVNNAGVLALASLREGKHEDIERIVRVNLLSQLWTVRTILPTMVHRKHGHIVSVCSMTALKPTPRGITYSASKGGVRTMMIALQDELVIDGMDEFVHTTTIYPWFINTRKELIDNIVNKTPSAQSFELITPEEVAHETVRAVKRNQEELIIPKMMVQYLGKSIAAREYRKIGLKIFVGHVPKYMEFES